MGIGSSGLSLFINLKLLHARSQFTQTSQTNNIQYIMPVNSLTLVIYDRNPFIDYFLLPYYTNLQSSNNNIRIDLDD